MKVFVAGASGVIGRRLIPRLLKAGHQVVGMTRSPQKAQLVERLGAVPVVCDVYDRARLNAALSETHSEVVIHLLTALPNRFKPRAHTEPTNRLRREGTRNLIDAARQASASRFLAESIAFLYDPAHGGPHTEHDPPWLDAPGSFADTVRAAVDLEDQALRAPTLEALVLRFGWLYGPGTWYAPHGSIGRDVRHRMYPIVGHGRGTWSFIHVEDAADAVLSTIERGEPGLYNIVDDEPAPMHAWLPAFAQAIAAPKPLRMPAWIAHIIAGGAAVEMAERLAGANNTKAKASLDWTPRYPNWHNGFSTLTETRARAST